MNATKYTFSIEIECLSKDSIQGLVFKAMEQLQEEVECGDLHMEDGDSVTWNISKEQVEF